MATTDCFKHRSIRRMSIALLIASLPVVSAQGPIAPTFSVLQQLSGESPQTRFGSSVAFMGDLDGDGTSEFLVAELGTMTFPAGVNNGVTVYSGANGSVVYDYDVAGTGFFLAAAEQIGDCNGDGRFDFAIIANTTTPMVADVRVYSGLDGSLLHVVTPSASVVTIDSVCGIGDLDGDGFDDFAVGVSSWGTSAPLVLAIGAIFIYSGATGNLIVQVTGQAGGHGLGFRVAGPGDANGDGFPDIAAYASSLPGQLSATFNIHVFALTPTSSTQLYQYTSPGQFSQFGDSISRAGDIDGDGRGDFMFGTPLNITTGLPDPFIVYSGATGLPIWVIPPPTSIPSRFGRASANVGDLDGDGFDEIAVSAPCETLGLPSPFGTIGAVYVYSSATRSLLFEVHDILPHTCAVGGGFADSSHGRPISGGDDIDGDGLDDLIIGTQFLSLVRIYRGAPAFAPSCGGGNVPSGNGTGFTDVFSLSNGTFVPTTGGPGRTLAVAPGSQVFCWMSMPPNHLGSTAPFALFGRVGPSAAYATSTLPLGIGTMCFTPDPLDATGDPGLVTVINTFGAPAGLIPGLPAFASAPPGTIVAAFNAPPFPIAVLFQGVIFDSSAGAVPLRVTNAMRLVVY